MIRRPGVKCQTLGSCVGSCGELDISHRAEPGQVSLKCWTFHHRVRPGIHLPEDPVKVPLWNYMAEMNYNYMVWGLEPNSTVVL